MKGPPAPFTAEPRKRTPWRASLWRHHTKGLLPYTEEERHNRRLHCRDNASAYTPSREGVIRIEEKNTILQPRLAETLL